MSPRVVLTILFVLFVAPQLAGLWIALIERGNRKHFGSRS